MPRGGARNRAGVAPVEGSERSERRGFKLTALPAEGYQGPIPEWPLPNPTDRELQTWESLWRTPQACVWSMPAHSWRVPVVAMYARTFVRCEDPKVGASVIAQLHRFGDQIGMTTAGLRELGWKVATDELAEKAATAQQPVASARRMRVVGDGG